MRWLAITATTLVVFSACKEKPKPDDDPLFRGYSASDSSGRIPIGGVNIWGYCQTQGFPTVGYRRGYIEGPQAAYDNWVCQTGTEQLKPENPKAVDILAACKWQYPQALAARPDHANHAWSWNCYRR